MLRLVAALALARAAELTAPGTGYSDADSCPPPETTPFGAVVTHSCSFCATTLTKAPLIRKDAAWQSVAFANHATDAARLVEVDAAGRELPRGTIAPGAEKTFRCQVGTTWRARRLETNEILLEHRVGAVRLVAEPPEDVHDFGVDDSNLQRRGKPPKPALPYKTSSHPRAPVSRHADGTVDYRFPRPFYNPTTIDLDLYYYDKATETETLQTTIKPGKTHTVATYWRRAFVVRDPATGRRVAHFEIPVVPIRDCAAGRAVSVGGADAAAAAGVVEANGSEPTEPVATVAEAQYAEVLAREAAAVKAARAAMPKQGFRWFSRLVGGSDL